VASQYFTPAEAAENGGVQVSTGGSNMAMDFVPSFVGQVNCQVGMP
jgi:hypothetical protein